MSPPNKIFAKITSNWSAFFFSSFVLAYAGLFFTLIIH